MRTETFHEEHDVELTEEERDIRGRQAARGALGLAKHDELVETEAEAWRTLKKTRGGEREQKLETLRTVSTAAETGREPRQVLCDEVLIGAMVVTRRLDMDPPADVSSRPATQDELRGAEKARAEKAKPTPLTAEQIAQKLATVLSRLDAKPHVAKWVEGQLAKGCPEATASEVKAAIALALENGRLLEDDDGKLRAGTPRQPGDDGGIVPDDYRPAAPH